MSYRRAAGGDGWPIGQGAERLCETWPQIREELIAGEPQSQPMRRVEIPKPGGGVCTLAIPPVTGRLIQQAITDPATAFDPTFSASNFGYRPGKSDQEAIKRARDPIAAGHH